jgi:hypothetical protein
MRDRQANGSENLRFETSKPANSPFPRLVNEFASILILSSSFPSFQYIDLPSGGVKGVLATLEFSGFVAMFPALWIL